MEIELVRRMLSGLALAHPKPTDSAELRAIRELSMAVLHIAESVHEIQQTQAGIAQRLAASN